MAETITWKRLRELAGFHADQGCAISLYLNLDPSLSPTSAAVDSRLHSLLADGEKSEWAHRGDLGHAQREALRGDFARIARFFAEEFDRDGAQGVAVFSAALDNFWSALSLAEPVSDRVGVGSDFQLAPLVPLIGRGDGAIVAMVGRERGDIYRLARGRLEEIADHTEEQPGQHDQGGWSQARYQRRIENLVHEHLKTVGEELDRRVRRLQSQRIVLVGPEEMRSSVMGALSNEARAAVVGWTSAEAHATAAQLLDVALPLLDEARAVEEREALERWREEAGKNGRASAGWADTLEAASDGRIELLLFGVGADREAWQCPDCGRASLADGTCPLDGTKLEQRREGIELAVRQTLAHGGGVWAVRRHHDLEPVEGIGALLRY